MRTKQPYVQIDPDVLERIRQIDLLSYLREFEPSNLVKVKGARAMCTVPQTRQLKDFQRQMVLVVERFRRLFCPRLSDKSQGI